MKELEALEILEAWLNGAISACKDLRSKSYDREDSGKDYEFYTGKIAALQQVEEECQFITLGYLKENSK